MLFEQRLNEAQLTSSEKDIGDYIIAHKYELRDLSTRNIAKEIFTSSATIVRFSKKLGYQGFNELKEDYIKELEYIQAHFIDIDSNIPFTEKNNIMEVAGIMSALMNESSKDTLNLIHHDSLQKATQLIIKAEYIHMFAIENNLCIAQNFKFKMLRIQKKVSLENTFGNQMYTIFSSSPHDCAIIISYSGETNSLLRIAEQLKERHIPIIVITSLGDNSLKKYAQCVLTISTREKLHSKIANFTTEYSIELILNTLYSCVFLHNYQKNLDTKISITKQLEISRHSTSYTLNENE